MEMATIVAVLAAMAAAVAFGVSTVMQYVGAQRAASVVDESIWHRLTPCRSRMFLLGIGLDIVGVGCAAIAVRTLPLFFVQAVTTSSVGITALLSSHLFGERLTSRQRTALGGVAFGLALLALGGDPGAAAEITPRQGFVLLALVPGLAMGVWLSRRRGRMSAAGYGALSGAAFGLAALAARVLPTPFRPALLLRQPTMWAAIGFTVLGFLLLVVGLGRGSPTTVSAASMSVETLLPAVIGVLFFGDTARPGMWPVAAVGFVLSLSCALSLIRCLGNPKTLYEKGRVPVPTNGRAPLVGARAE